MRDEVEEQLTQINDTALPGFEKITESTTHHLFQVHGKYLRPSLVLLTARALGDRYPMNIDTLVSIASAVELVHSASLVHDDIIDQADERRGHPSVNSVYGNKLAVLVGDLLYDQVFTVLAELTAPGPEVQIELLNLFTRTARKMCLGEIYDDQIGCEPDSVEFDHYLQVVDYKTAALMACCCRASALALGATSQDCDVVEEFGFRLGRTYQLVDDIVDQDSVCSDTDRMRRQALEETAHCLAALDQIGSNDGTSRLRDITSTVIAKLD